MMNYKPLRIYFILMIAAIVGFAWATWSGFAFYNDKVEKNTEYNGLSNRSRHMNRFNHK